LNQILFLSVKEQKFIGRENKQYYKDLEQRVKELEEENKTLKLELRQSKIFQSEKLTSEENYFYETLPKLIQTKPDEFRLSMYEN